MRQRFPTFEFLIKTEDKRGHARSLQLAIPRIKSRYVFYLEGDRVTDASLRDACSDQPTPMIQGDSRSEVGKDTISIHMDACDPLDR